MKVKGSGTGLALTTIVDCVDPHSSPSLYIVAAAYSSSVNIR